MPPWRSRSSIRSLILDCFAWLAMTLRKRFTGLGMILEASPREKVF